MSFFLAPSQAPTKCSLQICSNHLAVGCLGTTPGCLSKAPSQLLLVTAVRCRHPTESYSTSSGTSAVEDPSWGSGDSGVGSMPILMLQPCHQHHVHCAAIRPRPPVRVRMMMYDNVAAEYKRVWTGINCWAIKGPQPMQVQLFANSLWVNTGRELVPQHASLT